MSLVIPTFNRGDLIAETLESALAQSRPFAEIIVVDDGSSDDTAEVLASYAGKVRVIRTANQGVQAARNTGVAAATTPYVCLCDSDDLLNSDLVETLTSWLGSHSETDILYCNFVPFSEKTVQADKFSQAPAGFLEGGQREGDFLHAIPDLYLRLLAYQPLFPTGMTFKKAFYERIGGFNPAFRGVRAEDFEFTLRAVASGNVALCLRPLERIRKHSSNDSRDPMKNSLGEALILDFALEHHPAAANSYRTAVLESADFRRVQAFDGAFARGEFELAREILGKLRNRPESPNFRLKRFITLLPGLLRQALWRLIRLRKPLPDEKEIACNPGL